MTSRAPEYNWARNLAYSGEIVAPTSIEQARDLVARSRHVRALGTRHSFSTIADGELILSTAQLPERFELDTDARTVTVGGGAVYGHIAPHLEAAGWALPNLASLPHISVAGAVSTGTHGSGVRNQSLAAPVAAIELLTADGGTTTLRRGDADFDGAVVSLGALGIMTAITLDIVPSFEVEQTVYRAVPFDAVAADVWAALGIAYSVSIFTTWRSSDVIDQLWVKRRTDVDASLGDTVLGGALNDQERHPIPDVSPEQTTAQRGVPGRWHERLPHFRMEETPSVGDELQSEYFVDAARADEALQRLRGIAEQIAPFLFVCEIRAIARDDLWLSGAYEQDVVGFHFTWRPLDEVYRVLPLVEQQLLPLGARPHWAKVATADGQAIRAAYPRSADFAALAARMDPERVFVNDYLVDRLGL